MKIVERQVILKYESILVKWPLYIKHMLYRHRWGWFGEYILEQSVSVTVVSELIEGGLVDGNCGEAGRRWIFCYGLQCRF